MSPADKSRATRRAVGPTLLLAVVSVALTVALGEGAVRVLHLGPAIDALRPGDPNSPFRLSADPVLGWELKPSFRDPGHEGVVTNSAGLADRERTPDKPPGVRRIAMLGDSVVMGLYAGNLADTLPGRLEARLADAGVEVLNFGVRGYCTQAEVRLFETRGLVYAPDLVLVVFVRNDHRNFNAELGRDLAYVRPAWTEELFHRSQLFRLAAFGLDWWGFRAQLDPEWADTRHRAAFVDDNVDVGLRRLGELSRDRGFRAAVLVWPQFARDGPYDPAGLFEDGTRTRMKVETIAARHGLPVVRLSAPFRADFARRRADGEVRDAQELYSFDGMHPNPLGATVGAEILRNLLHERPEWLGEVTG